MSNDLNKNNPEKTVPTGEDLVKFAVAQQVEHIPFRAGPKEIDAIRKYIVFLGILEESKESEISESLQNLLEETQEKLDDVVPDNQWTDLNTARVLTYSQGETIRITSSFRERLSTFLDSDIFERLPNSDVYYREAFSKNSAHSSDIDPKDLYSHSPENIRSLVAVFIRTYLSVPLNLKTHQINKLKHSMKEWGLQFDEAAVDEIMNNFYRAEGLDYWGTKIDMLLDHLIQENDPKVIAEKRRDAAKENAPPPKGVNTQGKPKKLNF